METRVRRFGDEYTFHEMAVENIANMNQYSFDKVVTHCPHCFHTIGKRIWKNLKKANLRQFTIQNFWPLL